MLDDLCKEELGVIERGAGTKARSGMRGAAIARLEVAREGLWAHRSGEGVSVRKATPTKEDVLEPPADKGLGMGRNSTALAFKSRGDERGEEDALVAWGGCGADWP